MKLAEESNFQRFWLTEGLDTEALEYLLSFFWDVRLRGGAAAVLSTLETEALLKEPEA